MSIQQPSDLIPRPWAESGTKTVIPDTQQVYGAASFEDGFPIENSINLRTAVSPRGARTSTAFCGC